MITEEKDNDNYYSRNTNNVYIPSEDDPVLKRSACYNFLRPEPERQLDYVYNSSE
jgi:hypothetical protein